MNKNMVYGMENRNTMIKISSKIRVIRPISSTLLGDLYSGYTRGLNNAGSKKINETYNSAYEILLNFIIKNLREDKVIFEDFANLIKKTTLSNEDKTRELNELINKLKDSTAKEGLLILNNNKCSNDANELLKKTKTTYKQIEKNDFIESCKSCKSKIGRPKYPLNGLKAVIMDTLISKKYTEAHILSFKEQISKVTNFNQLKDLLDEELNDLIILEKMEKFIEKPEIFMYTKIIDEANNNINPFFISSRTLLLIPKICEKPIDFINQYQKERINQYKESIEFIHNNVTKEELDSQGKLKELLGKLDYK